MAGKRLAAVLLEKEVTLTLANKLVQVLKETGTVRPLMTRTDDYTISLDDRAGLANHRGGDLFISLHLGNSSLHVPSGFSVYYWSPATATPTVSPPSSQKPPWDQGQRPYWERSQELATLMQQELLRALPWPTGGVLEADLYLLRRVQMPAVLVELGSLSHLEEVAQLQKPAFQEAVARALVEAINQYRAMQEKELLIPGSKPE
jgi:N-acetylmuramoyl-L-alanine amidase